MGEWWNGLDGLVRAFYVAAGFFSLIFLWQFLSSLIGLAGEGADVDVDMDMDVDIDAFDLDGVEAGSIEEAAESIAAFRVISIRAMLAFCTLFSWASAMYLDGDKPVSTALLLGTLWGLAAWGAVALVVNWMRKLAETGNMKIATCVGMPGSVYLDIPADGAGEIKILVSGVMTCVKARTAGEQALPAGTPIKVIRKLDATTVEVSGVDAPKEGAEHSDNGKEE